MRSIVTVTLVFASIIGFSGIAHAQALKHTPQAERAVAAFKQACAKDPKAPETNAACIAAGVARGNSQQGAETSCKMTNWCRIVLQ